MYDESRYSDDTKRSVFFHVEPQLEQFRTLHRGLKQHELYMKETRSALDELQATETDSIKKLMLHMEMEEYDKALSMLYLVTEESTSLLAAQHAHLYSMMYCQNSMYRRRAVGREQWRREYDQGIAERVAEKVARRDAENDNSS
jgi:hypothetical protein